IRLIDHDRISGGSRNRTIVVSREADNLQALILAGAKRLLARATNSRSLDDSYLSPRLLAAVEKYLVKDDTPAEPAIDKFLDGLHADDLCLVIACERGDQVAWNGLFEGYGPNVRLAWRTASFTDPNAYQRA